MNSLTACWALFLCTYLVAGDIDCPAPRSPDNGQTFFTEFGDTVRFKCNYGFTLEGAEVAVCRNKKWSNPTPKCVSSSEFKEDEKVENTNSTRDLFSWKNEESAEESKGDDGMVQDENRVNLILYPSSNTVRRVYQSKYTEASPRRSPSYSERVQEARRRAEARRSKSESSLASRYEAAHRRKEEERSEALARRPSYERNDDKGGQTEESLRHAYVLAEMRRQEMEESRGRPVTVARPAAQESPVVLSLSESQLAWINSLHPELRDRYLKDLYTTRAKEAEESSRAQQFLQRYEDTYRYVYPPRRSQAIRVQDASSYDYSCHYTDHWNQRVFIRAPQLPNAHVHHYNRHRNPNYPYNDYMSATYKCGDGYTLEADWAKQLFCSQKQWVGTLPRCIPVRG